MKKGQKDKKRGRTGPGNSSSGSETVKKKKTENHVRSRKNEKNEEYVIIIDNVEKHLGAIHEQFLVPYCELNPNLKGNPRSQQRDAYYTIKCRTETHSAEVNFFSVPGEPFSNFLQERKKDNSVKDDEEKDGTAMVEDVQDATHTSHSNSKTDSLPKLVEKLRYKPYYGNHLEIAVSLPGYQDGEVLLHPAEGSNRKPIVQKELSQNELVCCVAKLSRPLPPKEFIERFRDVPGFVSGWMLHSEGVPPQPYQMKKADVYHYKVVFRSKAHLFEAKNLLDQFELDNKVRVKLLLPDHLQSQVNDYEQEKEKEEDPLPVADSSSF